MKTLFLMPLVVLLSGCFHQAVVRQPVTVEVPVPYCPAPPTVPACTWLTDQLTIEDVNDPGKVGQAYKADMACARETMRIHELILQQYTKTSQSFEEVQKRIRDLSDKMKAASTVTE